MTTHEAPNPEHIERFLHDYMLFLDGEGDLPSLEDLDPRDRDEAAGRIHFLETAMTATAEVPPGAVERIALHFGFDRAGASVIISGPKLKRARQQAGLDLKQISAAMAAAGTPIRTSDLLHIETASSTPVEQPIVTTLVAMLGTSVSDIEEFRSEVTEIRAMLSGARFEQVIAQWAAEHGRDVAETRGVVHRQVLATKYRNESISEAQLAELIQAILSSLAQ